MRGLTLLVAVASRWVMTSGSLTVPGAGVGPLPTVLPLYTPPVTGYIGPQPGDNGANVTGTVVVYAGDVCNPGEVSSAAISGRVVFVSADSTATMACLYEQAYMNFVARDVLAVILCYIDEFPSYNIWLHDGTFGSRTRALRPMFLLTGPSANVYEALIGNLPGRNVTIYPDVNVWEAAYAGLSYQLFVRGFPSAILILSGLSAAVFFIVHMRNIAARVTRDTPSNRSVPAARRLRLVASYIALPHVTLFVEMVTATAAGLVLAVGGYYSTPNIEFPVQAFFSTLLGGWGLACSIACAMTWTRKLTEVIGARDVSWITRIIRGDKPIVTALLCTIPIVLDTAVTSNFTHNYCPPILANGYGVISTRMVLKVQVGVGELSLRRDANVDKVMQRLSRCALGLSLSMILNCCGSGIIGAAPVYAYTPEGWTLAWTLTYTGRALDSVFRVAMFKPRLRPTSTAATAVVHPGHPGPAAPM